MESKAQTTALAFNTPTDIVIVDPCYFIPDADWAATQYGENLPFVHITQRTGIGDWSCNVINGNGGVIGSFAADTGQCTIAALQDVQAYNADAFKGIARGCVCVIKGFQGTIYTCYGDDGVLRIAGVGNIAFTNKILWDL